MRGWLRVIPEDWSVYDLPDVIWYQEGPGLRKWQFQPKGLKVINVTNLQDDGFLDLDKTERHISWDEFEKTYKHFMCDAGDLVIASSGNSYCKSSTVRECDLPLLMNTSVIRFKPINDFSKGYMDIYLRSQSFKEKIDLLITGGAQPNFGPAHLNKIKIPAPTDYYEQTAIANVLLDSDALIGALEQLIAKKQDIKSATMQQLLTGRTRLPTFALRPDGTPKGYKPSELGEIPEDWEVAPFGKLFETSISRKNLRATDWVSFVGMQDVTEAAQLQNQTSITYEKVKTGFTYFERGDVLVAKITPCFENGKGCYTKELKSDVGFGSTEFHVLRAVANADSVFIYYWTTQGYFRKQLESEMVGSAGHRRVPFPAIQSYMIPCSMNKQEQTAIATILSDMDNELQALTQKLEKARAIKQGMMQQLLTGKIRLPLEVGA
nr:restriction endonuclease subunit S [Aeromonas veronii]